LDLLLVKRYNIEMNIEHCSTFPLVVVELQFS